jgi:DNA topoisomerase VI subunit A
MEPAVIAGLVKVQSPDHAAHTQGYLRTVKSTEEVDVIEVSCSCNNSGLTLTVVKGEPGKVVGHFTVEEGGKVVEHHKKGKGSDA